MAKRFLLVTEEWAGSGHRMAAEALHEVLDSHEGIERSRIVGGLTTASPALRELSRFFYLSMLRYGRPMWQRIYEQDRLFGTILKMPLGWWLSRRLENTLIDIENPDVVIATHAYCLSALAQSKQRMDKPFHLVSIPTDYHLNRFWVHPEIDTYIVAHQQIADRLIRSYQVHASKIQVLGIPIRSAFTTAAKVEKSIWKKQLGLEEQFTVLVCGGEGGYGRIAEVMKALAKEMEPLQLIVITGKNEKLYEELQGLTGKYPSTHRILLRKFEAQMWQWIGAADVYITKPGGISCAEAMALRTPLLLYQPLPGQERENSSFLLDQKAAVLANDTEDIRTWIRHWRNQKQRDKIIEQMEQVRRPEAAREIAEYLLHM
ncbi:MGDG synthase family glycosyltransferase [Brevibacillus reuszeri]|uniref:MGDG synthase family glycosyltransferase n=1 Tax=Brevibacillus reuszeri TaxID=54915 RepID=UPI000CCC0837|nr:glycosyltransferase [Brevibacillus reuszeri]